MRPRWFETLNRRLGFATHTRRWVYVHGVIETGLGLGLVSTRLRGATAAAGVLYLGHLLTNLLRTRQRDGQAYRAP